MYFSFILNAKCRVQLPQSRLRLASLFEGGGFVADEDGGSP